MGILEHKHTLPHTLVTIATPPPHVGHPTKIIIFITLNITKDLLSHKGHLPPHVGNPTGTTHLAEQRREQGGLSGTNLIEVQSLNQS